MSDNNTKKTEKSSMSPQNLGQKATEEMNKLTETIQDAKKENKEIIISVVEEKGTIVKRAMEARDKMVEFYQEHSKVVLVILGSSVIILAYGMIKIIC